jgi:hypothetical protein
MWNTHGPLWTAREGAEARMPPSARAMVELLRLLAFTVEVRENRTGSLRYSIDGARECTAHQMIRRFDRGVYCWVSKGRKERIKRIVKEFHDRKERNKITS